MVVKEGMPTLEEVFSWHKTLSNWGRWGPDDERGALNLITPQKRLEAVKLVREGIVVSCARTIVFEPTPDEPVASRHFMLRTGESMPPTARGRGGAADSFLVAPHGRTITHLDAHSHVFVRADVNEPWTMYNGKPKELVTASEGALAGSIEQAADSIVTRGVLLDIARVRNVDWIESTDPIMPEDFDAAEAAEGVHVGPGDVLFVRSGWPLRRSRLGPKPPADGGMIGLQAACAPWMHERDVVILGGDNANDVDPAQYPEYGGNGPIHGLCMGAMGMWLLDNADFEDLAATCNRLGRWEFMITMAPLKFTRGTGCPVNPLAIF